MRAAGFDGPVKGRMFRSEARWVQSLIWEVSTGLACKVFTGDLKLYTEVGICGNASLNEIRWKAASRFYHHYMV